MATDRTYENGVLLVDKPGGMTSHDVVAAVRKLVRPLRVGHTGTLDPIATGLLILCIGKATRIAGFIEAQFKIYRASVLLGTETDTLDITGRIIREASPEKIGEDDIREAACSFVGEINQIPPAFSAIKVDGVRAYAMARHGKDIRLKPRKVEIRRIEIEEVRLPRVTFLLECSKGTYVRALCRDLGSALQVGGCMESLRRCAVGDFTISDAVPLDRLDKKESVLEAMIPTSKALPHLPELHCTAEQAGQIADGIRLAVDERMGRFADGVSWTRALGPDGDLIALGRLSREGEAVLFHPKKVLLNKRELSKRK
jgi:tRNA pseudouridine55 synthase